MPARNQYPHIQMFIKIYYHTMIQFMSIHEQIQLLYNVQVGEK